MSTEQTNEAWPKKCESGKGTEEAWTVEARNTGNAPQVVGNQTFDNRWRQVEFVESSVGVPSARRYSQASLHGLLTYPAAQALRWWVHAQADIDYQGILVETRLVKHLLRYEFNIEAVSAHALIGSDDRSNMMPDWGVTAQPTPAPPLPVPPEHRNE